MFRLGNHRPGRLEFPGFVLLALVLIGLSTMRGARLVAHEDPRLALLRERRI
jgi:hypothetical protein